MTRGRILGYSGIALAVVLGIVALFSVYVVDPTKYALVLRFGQPVAEIRDPGLYFKLPIVDNVVYIEKRLLSFAPNPEMQNLDEDNEIVTGDRRRINVTAFGRYRVVEPLAFFQAVGGIETANSRLLAILDASVRAVLNTANFQQIVAERRAELMDQITLLVAERARAIGVEVVDVRIQRVDLPELNARAIYSRMQTERQQEAAQIRAEGDEAARRIRATADRNVVVTIAIANQEAEATRGRGDAEANRIFAEAFALDPDFFAFYRSMQAYQQALVGNTTTMVLSPSSAFFRYLNEFIPGATAGAATNLALPPVTPIAAPAPEAPPALPAPAPVVAPAEPAAPPPAEAVPVVPPAVPAPPAGGAPAP